VIEPMPWIPPEPMLSERLIGDVLDHLREHSRRFRSGTTRGDVAHALCKRVDRGYARWRYDDLVTTVGRALKALDFRKQARRDRVRWFATENQVLLSITTPAQR
jgi:hypothetical protein